MYHKSYLSFMTRFFCLSSLFLSMTLWCAAQAITPLNEKRHTDSLNALLEKATSDSGRARVSFVLSEYWRARDTAKSRKYLEQGRTLGNGYPLTRALYPFYEGQFYFFRDTTRAIAAFLKAAEGLSAFKTKDAYMYSALSWFNYGVMQRRDKGDGFVADIWLNKAIPMAEKSGDNERLAHFYGQVATMFMYNAQFDKAEVYNSKAIALLESNYPNSATLMFVYLSATSNYVYLLKYPEAKKTLDKAKKMLNPYPESINYPTYYYNEALYYIGVEELDKALVSLNKGIPMARKLNQAQILSMLVFRKFHIFSATKQYAAAREVLMELLKEGVLTADAGNRKTIYQQLAATNASLGIMGEAYQWSEKYSKLSDSLYEARLKNHMNELETKFRNAEQEKKIAVLEKEKEKAALTIKNKQLLNWLLGAVAVFLLIVAAFALLYYRNNKKLSLQKELNYQQQLKETEQEKQIQVSQAMLQGEEQERERVARDLHDGLGGMLAGIGLNLSALLTDPSHTNGKELRKVIDQVDHSAGELRRIVRNLMPEALLKFGLETALKELCEALMTDTVHITFQSFGISGTIPKQTQVTIYRIVQEMLSNALRHANATAILLQCTQNDEAFFITVEDNGKGFDTRLIDQAKGIGLNNIKKRVDYLNGKMNIEAAINEGTIINIELNVRG